jgi:hypothetical protein
MASYALRLIVLAALMLHTTVAFAQEEDTSLPSAAPAQAAAQPEVQPAPAEPEPPAPPPADLRSLFVPGLYDELAAQWGPVRRNEPLFTDPGNVTILSLPPGCVVYLAPVADIRAAGQQGGVDVPVEDIVFQQERLLGTTPLTIKLPPAEYVLALRAPARLAGFDGGCVRKQTMDVITGGKRHAYHLYPLRKRAGQYMLFMANFSTPEYLVKGVDLALRECGVFAVGQAAMVELLAQYSSAPEEQREAIAQQLIELGVAYYDLGGQTMLVKATLIGEGLRLDEWVVEP